MRLFFITLSHHLYTYFPIDRLVETHAHTTRIENVQNCIQNRSWMGAEFSFSRVVIVYIALVTTQAAAAERLRLAVRLPRCN